MTHVRTFCGGALNITHVARRILTLATHIFYHMNHIGSVRELAQRFNSSSIGGNATVTITKTPHNRVEALRRQNKIKKKKTHGKENEREKRVQNPECGIYNLHAIIIYH